MNLIDGAEARKHDAKTIGIRPEHITLSSESGDWKGKVGVAEHLGSDTFLHVEVDGIGPVTVRADGDVGPEPRRPGLADARASRASTASTRTERRSDEPARPAGPH